MGKFLKSGKVVIMLQGRYAGRKAVIIKTHEDGFGDRKFSHCVVAGVDRYPRKVTRSMNKAKVLKRSKCKPFIKCVNFNHIMPTRYTVDLDVKKILKDAESYASPESRSESKKAIKEVFEGRYLNQEYIDAVHGSAGKNMMGMSKREKNAMGVAYFFTKLRF